MTKPEPTPLDFRTGAEVVRRQNKPGAHPATVVAEALWTERERVLAALTADSTAKNKEKP